ncbi:MAG: hypothetical protein V3U65_11735 [Granulosicoccaceae bacterium]
MNRTTISIALAVSCLLIACGNKGDLFLETDQAIADEIKLLDESLDELEQESAAPSTTSPDTAVLKEPTDDAASDEAVEAVIKKAKKKADDILQSNE